MPAWTLAEAQTKLTEWKTAETQVAAGQAYSVGGRTFTRADLGLIAERISYYGALVTRLERSQSSGGMRIRGGVPQ